MTRLILAILAGLAAGAVLSTMADSAFHAAGIYPPPGQPMMNDGLLAIAFAYRAVFAIGGTYLAAMLANNRARTAVWALGIIGTLAWLGGSIALWEYARPWYNIAGIATSIPFALIGGKLYEMRSKQRTAETTPQLHDQVNE